MTPCPRCGRVLAALARRGLHRSETAASGPWIALHLGDAGRHAPAQTPECRLADDEAANVVQPRATVRSAA